MQNEHVISDEMVHEIQLALLKNENWMAYNNSLYFIGKDGIFFFTSKDKAKEFADNNISDRDSFHVIHFDSIADVFRQLPYGERIIADPDSNPLYNKDGNAFTDALIEQAEKINSHKNKIIMDEKTMGFNETQLKRSGFAEAFTPELVQKMKDGVPVIQHNFKKEYDGDKVDATLHLKKSATSDVYFLNKYDLQLQKAGQDDPVKQTFYIGSKKPSDEDGQKHQQQKQDKGYTLKEAYNLLAGRPVFKTLVSKQGEEYEAWAKINFQNKLENGNYEMKKYSQGYGFDLENVLGKYAIKELGNEKYKESLIDSLHRGNLQKATFVGADGKEEKLYVSPNITFGAINVYDENKQRLSTTALADKQYIGKEFSESLIQRATQAQKQQGQQTEIKQTQEVKSEQKQDKKQKQESNDDQKKEQPKKKPRQKV